MKKKIFLFFSILIIISIGAVYYLLQILDNDQKLIIKKYIFPYQKISMLENNIIQLEDKYNNLQNNTRISLIEFELNFKNSNNNISTIKSSLKLNNNMRMEKNLLQGFFTGISNFYPGSGFIDFYKNDLFLLSSKGILAYSTNINEIKIFRQIQNNINDFIDLKQFSKSETFSLKDIFIFKEKIFISFTEEMKEDCWNTSIIYGDINYENIVFKKLFTPKECIHSTENLDKEFTAHQAGGRMISFDDNHILFTIGDYRSRHLAQNKKSVNGKIIKINIDNSEYEIITMGHRNPQGLYFDKESNIILTTEHGPRGGDEINLIEVDKINKENILNYGWAISSAGEHYGEANVKSWKKKYVKYPLYKSHSKYGFVEPLKSFVPSIGIAEVIKISENKYVVTSMKAQSLYFFELNSQKQIINLKKVEVFERVRDIKLRNNKLYLFLEDTASIGVIDLNTG